MKLKCLVVDDEKLSRTLIQTYISKLPFLQASGECSSALEVLDVVQHQQFDLMFLDINMPDLTGIDLLKQAKTLPPTILCTAYSEYALESYELDVIDYLLKPIDFRRFIKAAEKAVTRLSDKIPGKTIQMLNQSLAPQYIFVKSEYKDVKIEINQIRHIEAMEKYVRIHTKDQKIMTLMSMSKILDILQSEKFHRIHRSFIINTDFIDFIEGNRVSIEGRFIPISKSNKKYLQQHILKSR